MSIIVTCQSRQKRGTTLLGVVHDWQYDSDLRRCVGLHTSSVARTFDFLLFAVPVDSTAFLHPLPHLSTYMLRLLPGISSLLISTLPVHSPAFFPKPLPSFSSFSCG